MIQVQIRGKLRNPSETVGVRACVTEVRVTGRGETKAAAVLAARVQLVDVLGWDAMFADACEVVIDRVRRVNRRRVAA